MNEKDKKPSGLQKIMRALAVGAFVGCVLSYESLSEEEKIACNKAMAKQMFKKACDGKLSEPYSEYEREFIKKYLD